MYVMLIGASKPGRENLKLVMPGSVDAAAPGGQANGVNGQTRNGGINKQPANK